MKIYLAGPMNGYEDFNFPAFNKAAQELRAQGHEVFSPAEDNLKLFDQAQFKNKTGNEAEIEGFCRRKAFQSDTTYISLHADAIAMLPGWEHSSGAFAEWALARTLKLKFIYLEADNAQHDEGAA